MTESFIYQYKERSVQGWFTNEHYVLFFTPFPAGNKSDSIQLTGQYLKTLKSLGYRIVCVYCPLEYRNLTEEEKRETDEQFLEYADHFYKVPLTTALASTDQNSVNMYADELCGAESFQKAKEICDEFSITVCFINHTFFSPVFEALPAGIRKVLVLHNEEVEISACRRADVVVTASQSNYAPLQRSLTEKELYFFPLADGSEGLHEKTERERTMQNLLARPFEMPDEVREHFLHYHDVMLKYLYRYITDPKDKVFIEIGPDDHLSFAKTLKANGAARVIALQTFQQKHQDLPEGIEFRVVSPTRWESVKDSCIDVVYGVGVLEHIMNFEEIAAEIYRVLKPGGCVLLQGGPLWGASHGHHTVVFDDNTGKIKYNFIQADKNPVEPWMHLALTEEEMREKLVQKMIPLEDARKIVNMIFHSDIGSNKKLADEIVAPFKKKLHVEAIRYLAFPEENMYYRIAREKYSENDLKTDCFIIYAKN